MYKSHCLFFVDSEATSENATFLAPTNHRLVSSFYFGKTNYEAFLLFYLAPCSYVVVVFFFPVLFSIVLTSLGEYVLLVHLLVYLACVTFCLFSLPLEPRQANLCLRAFRHDNFSLRMPSHSEGPGIWLSVWMFLLTHCLYERAAEVLARLCGCAGSPEPSLLA